MDFTKPVNPSLDNVLGASGITLAAADAIKLYNGSGGGTGFDLAQTGFPSIQYIRVQGAAGYYAGEVDAFSDVRPAVLGESLTIAPGNLTNHTGTLFFQEPGNPATNALQIGFQEVNEIAMVATAHLQDTNALVSLPNRLVDGATVTVTPMLVGELLQFNASLTFHIGAHYTADGSDLDAYSWNGTNWTRLAFNYDSIAKAVTLEHVTNSVALAVVQITTPSLAISRNGTGFQFQFIPVAHWVHTLERSTDLTTWSVIGEVTPTDTSATTLLDETPPADKAFYRLRLHRP